MPTWTKTSTQLPPVDRKIAVRGRFVELAPAVFDGLVFVCNGVQILPEDIEEWVLLGDEE
jgi:hypothetical protein